MVDLRLLAAAVVAASIVCGCSKPDISVSDAQGNKVSVSGDGTKSTFTGADGKSATVQSDPSGGVTETVHDDKGTSTFQAGTTLTEADLGLPFYPGSVEKASSAVKTDTPEESVISIARTAPDGPSKVIAFYKDKVKSAVDSLHSGGGTEIGTLFGKLDSGADVNVVASREVGKTETVVSVTVSLKKGKG